MKPSAKVRAYAYTCVCGASASLMFIAAFDVFVMLAFNETSKHPIEFPSMLAFSAVAASVSALCLCFIMKYVKACERRRRVIFYCVVIFFVSAAVSYVPWTLILWVFDSDAGFIG